MSKKVINITKKKLNIGKFTLEPLKPVVFKDVELTISNTRLINEYVNLGFLKVFDVQEKPLLYTQLQEYKEEQQINLQQEEQKEVEIVKVDETKEDVEKKTSKTTNKRKNTKKQEEEEVNEQ